MQKQSPFPTSSRFRRPKERDHGIKSKGSETLGLQNREPNRKLLQVYISTP